MKGNYPFVILSYSKVQEKHEDIIIAVLAIKIEKTSGKGIIRKNIMLGF